MALRLPALVASLAAVTAVLLPTPALADSCSEHDITCQVNGGQDGTVVASAEDLRGGQVTDHAAPTCPDCEWAMVPACRQANPDNPSDFLCTRATQCALGTLYRVYVRRAGTNWSAVGSRCLRPNTAPTVATSAKQVREEAVRRFGAGRPSFQPPDGGIVNVPTIFSANQAGTAEHQLSLLGQALRLTGTARWHWDFGDGTALDTHQPGGAYPDASVTHTYTRPGRYTVTLTTTWTASYAFNGAPPQPVPGAAITATAAPLTLQVRQARSQLTGG